MESILARQETCPGLQYTALFTLHANKVVLVKLSSISHYSQAPLVVVKITNAQFKKPGQASQVVGITTGRQKTRSQRHMRSIRYGHSENIGYKVPPKYWSHLQCFLYELGQCSK